MRVLQLLPAGLAHEPLTLANQIADRLGERFIIERRVIPDSTSATVRAALALRRNEHDLVHLFGQRLLPVAAAIPKTRVFFSPDSFLRRRDRNWLRAIVRYRDVTTICPTDTQRRSIVESGVPIGKTILIRPGVDFGSVARRDERVRERLGFAKDDYVILAAGESSVASNHRLTCWAASVLNVLDSRYKMLAWKTGGQTELIQSFARRSMMPFATFAGGAMPVAGEGGKSPSRELHTSTLRESRESRPYEVRALTSREPRESPSLVAVTADLRSLSFEHLLAAADCVLATSTEPAPTLPLQLAMAAGVPIVSTPAATATEIVQDRSTALLVPRPHPRLLSRRILDLREDVPLMRQLVDRARAEAYEFFAVSKAMEMVGNVYET